MSELKEELNCVYADVDFLIKCNSYCWESEINENKKLIIKNLDTDSKYEIIIKKIKSIGDDN